MRMDDKEYREDEIQLESALSLTRAVTRAGETLMLAYPEVANILEISQARAKALFAEEYLLDANLDEWARALYFIRLFTALDSLLSDNKSDRLWLTSHNIALGDTPLNLIQSSQGLISVLHYVENSGNHI